MSDSEKKSIYDKLTPSRKKFVDDFLKMLEADKLDWKKGWLVTGSPVSAITGKHYNGVNRMFLGIATMQRGYSDNRWVTYNQMEDKGWSFKRNEQGNNLGKGAGVPIEYFEFRDKVTKKPFDRHVLDGMTEDEKNEYMDENVYVLRKYYHVFNGDIIDGIPEKQTALADPAATNDRAENLIQLWSDTVVPISYGGDRAYYTKATDTIRLPAREKFYDLPGFYETALHEISHSTGHESRLNRDMGEGKDTPEYAVEELRAEIAAMFLVQDLGVAATDKHVENNAAYVKSWHERIKDDPNVLFKAIADAEKITKFVLAKEQYNANVAESDEDETVREVAEEKSEIYVRPSEVAARAEETAKPQPVDTEIKGIEKITDMDDGEILERAYYYKKEKAGYNCIDSKLLTTLLQFYFYRDEEDLLSIFEVNAVDNIFNKRIMLLSDDGKCDLFSKQIKYFLDGKELNNLNLVSIIENWFRFSEFSKILEQEDNIIDSLIKNEGIYGREIDYLIEAYDKPDNNDFNNFISKLENKLNSNKLKDKLALLDKYWKNKDYEMLYKEVYTLSKLNIIFTESTPKRLKPIVENFISQHDYFIDNLMGEIDYNQWDLAFKMIDFAKQYGFEVALKTHIDGLKKNDKSSEMRYQLLIKQLD